MSNSEHCFVVLAYKESPHLLACLESLKAQVQPSRVVIATSTPNNHISNLAAKFQFELRVNEKAEGIASDWNFALSVAPSALVTLTHQDDIYLPKFSKLVNAASKKHPNTAIFFCDYAELVAETVRAWNLNLAIKRFLILGAFGVFNSLRSAFFKNLLVAFGSPICCPSVTYNLNLLRDFRFNRDYLINMDWDAWLRIFPNTGSVTYIPKRLVLHRIHEDSATTAGIKDTRRKEEDRRIFARLWPSSIAYILSNAYCKSYCSNQILTRKES